MIDVDAIKNKVDLEYTYKIVENLIKKMDTELQIDKTLQYQKVERNR